MTTIAYRAGVIAADTGLSGGGAHDCHLTKIAKNKDGSVAGAAGNAWWISAFLKWFKDGGEFPAMPEDDCTSAIVIGGRKNIITLYESEKGQAKPYPVRAPYYAIGSGKNFALGAMFVDAHPIDAIKAAMKHDDSTYGKVQALKVGW